MNVRDSPPDVMVSLSSPAGRTVVGQVPPPPAPAPAALPPVAPEPEAPPDVPAAPAGPVPPLPLPPPPALAPLDPPPVLAPPDPPPVPLWPAPPLPPIGTPAEPAVELPPALVPLPPAGEPALPPGPLGPLLVVELEQANKMATPAQAGNTQRPKVFKPLTECAMPLCPPFDQKFTVSATKSCISEVTVRFFEQMRARLHIFLIESGAKLHGAAMSDVRIAARSVLPAWLARSANMPSLTRPSLLPASLEVTVPRHHAHRSQ